MSQATDAILVKLKALTLLEAVELVSQIEETFRVDASTPAIGIMATPRQGGEAHSAAREKTTFSVVLDHVADDKRVSTLKVIRSLTDLGLKEAKDFCSSLPKVVKENVSKEEVASIKRELEKAGGKVTLLSSK
jgi:large subunit ribosomal protein L7/L12